nr:hypothetical protein [Tanacetum cinerariifolium]
MTRKPCELGIKGKGLRRSCGYYWPSGRLWFFYSSSSLRPPVNPTDGSLSSSSSSRCLLIVIVSLYVSIVFTASFILLARYISTMPGIDETVSTNSSSSLRPPVNPTDGSLSSSSSSRCLLIVIVSLYVSNFINKLDENIKKIIKEQVKVQVKKKVSKIFPRIEKLVNDQLESEVLTRSSNEAKTSHAVAANLSEFELKKILIEKWRVTNQSTDQFNRRLSTKH